MANYFLCVLFRISLNDTTNAFKAYRKEVIDGCRPFVAAHFESNDRAAAEGDRARLHVDDDSNHGELVDW